jgi:hypothetical protein
MSTERWLRWLPVVAPLLRVLLPVIHPVNMLVLRIRNPRRFRWYSLSDWSWGAFLRGDYRQTESLAREYLALAREFRDDWNYGNAIHDANSLLGLCSLERGDVEAAKDYLLKAGSTPGSPQLNTFGPRMVLAREMVHARELGTVLAYLDLVARFWCRETDPRFKRQPSFVAMKAENRRWLKQWKSDVRRGIVPDHPHWRP